MKDIILYESNSLGRGTGPQDATNHANRLPRTRYAILRLDKGGRRPDTCREGS